MGHPTEMRVTQKPSHQRADKWTPAVVNPPPPPPAKPKLLHNIRMITAASLMARVSKPAFRHSCRHLLPTHPLEDGSDIRTLDDLHPCLESRAPRGLQPYQEKATGC